MYLRCRKEGCTGIVDPDTLVCLMCGREHVFKLLRTEEHRLKAVNGSRGNRVLGTSAVLTSRYRRR